MTNGAPSVDQLEHYPSPELPSRAATIVVTLVFGVFGVIPAAVHSSRAAAAGHPTSRYWKAFGITFAATVVAWVALVALVLSPFLIASSSEDTFNGPTQVVVETEPATP